MLDRNFDDLVEHFSHKIYQSEKGRLRLDVIWHLLGTHLPKLEQGPPLRILDLGCGLGQLGLRLAALGHHVTFTDLSVRMLEQVKNSCLSENLSGQVDFVHAPLQELPTLLSPDYDLVLCHAVMEWMAEPQQAISSVSKLLAPGGTLSLTFYNLAALIFRNLIRGNLRKVKFGSHGGDPGSLTPDNPLQLQTVVDWLEHANYEVRSVAGVRCFFDYMERPARERISYEDLLEMELLHCQQPPYAQLGRYIHLLCCKSENV